MMQRTRCLKRALISRFAFRGRLAAVLLPLCMLLLMLQGCGEPESNEPSQWHIVADIEAAALLAVHGTSQENVWLVGADDGKGPLALHYDGQDWTRHDTGAVGDLWWVRAFEDGTVYMAGSDAIVLRYRDGEFERLDPPGLGKHTLFGIWGAASDDIYAVGSAAGRNGFVWHFNGEAWQDLVLPEGITLDYQNDLPTLTKVWGADAQTVWVVGGEGTLLQGNHRDGFTVRAPDTENLLFAVHGSLDSERIVVVGGANQGLAFEVAGGSIVESSPEGAPLMQGVWVTADGTAWMSGAYGYIYKSEPSEPWVEIDHGLPLAIQSLHSIWVAPSGEVWSVGGNVLAGGLDAGVAISTEPITPITISPDPPPPNLCPEEGVVPHPEGTIARQWNEQLLGAIRRDTPRPTVHARNLFHLSAALWDVWVAYSAGDASPYLVSEDHSSTSTDESVAEAMSYAAYRLLTHRYTDAIGGEVTTDCFDAFMEHLNYPIDDLSTLGDTPRAFGVRVAERYIEAYAADGANEANDYADPDGYRSPQPKLVVDMPGSGTDNPLDWQQIVLAEAVTQNGIPEGSGVREYIGAHWGAVTPFAMSRPAPDQPYYTLDNAPIIMGESLLEHTMEVLRRTSWLDVDHPKTIDISPASIGNSTLGSDDGAGYDINPATGLAYESIMVKRSDFGRVLAEFWADGPDSETPPGHWNTIANIASDDPDNERRLFGAGDPLAPLSWDVHVYFALNGAVHDAAIAAWELKREYVTSRPITLIRTLGARGQRTDPSGPSYHIGGLPLEDGLVEVVTEESSAEGQRHAHLSRYKGEIAVWSWRGEPGDRDNQFGGHAWIRAKEWLPYQRRTFVSPAFPGYASGHSAFSRAAATVLATITGSPFFPGGSSELTFEPGFLFFEAGPSAPVTLRWATYFDAADQAGSSRLWGGIHVAPDDFDGRIIGAQIGQDAIDLARTYFEGTAAVRPVIAEPPSR